MSVHNDQKDVRFIAEVRGSQNHAQIVNVFYGHFNTFT